MFRVIKCVCNYVFTEIKIFQREFGVVVVSFWIEMSSDVEICIKLQLLKQDPNVMKLITAVSKMTLLCTLKI